MAPNVFKWTDFAFGHGLRLAAILLIAIFLNRLLRSLTRRLIAKDASGKTSRIPRMHEQHAQTMGGILYSGGTAIIIVGAILTALPEFGFNITPIAAVAGLASLSIGFGAQHLVRDIINGFFCVVEDQYVVGETVRIGSVTGRVEHLTLRRTVIRDLQGAVVSISNGDIAEVANLSRDYSQSFVDIAIPLDGPADTALTLLERISGELRSDAAWSPMLVDGPRVLGIESLGPSGIMLRMQLRSIPERQDDVARELRRRIQRRFAQENIRMSGVQAVQLVAGEQSNGSGTGTENLAAGKRVE